MKVSIFGLGYVGCINGSCMAKDGHMVWGIDINKKKVEMINNGRSPIIEPKIGKIIKDAVSEGRFRATLDAKVAINKCDISIICVSTKSIDNGSIDLDHIKKVSRDIGKVLAKKKKYHLIVFRSTILPGTTERTLIPILEKYSGKKAGKDFGVCFNPEFLREGSSVLDYYNPPQIVIGGTDNRSIGILKELCSNIKAPTIVTSIKVAETVKYVSNIFHSLKVCFANEIGTFCEKMGIDSHEVMKIFCMDKKLNLSSYYLKPGFAFGGSCLPKDLRALLYKSKQLDIDLPLLNAITRSNENQIQKGVNMILNLKKKRIGILGLSFKAGTDDLRESPMVKLTESLIGKGYSIKIYDKNVSLAKSFGANKEYILKKIPHISLLMCSSIKEVMDSSDIIVIGNNGKGFKDIIKMRRKKQIIVDFVRIVKNYSQLNGAYKGICWS